MISITKNGKQLDESLYTIDRQTKTFSSNEDWLKIETDESKWTFNTCSFCTLNTGSFCTLNTGPSCIFNTGANCIFDTGSFCMFKTSYECKFDTGSHCTFCTDNFCTFKTGEKCVCVRRDIYEIVEIPKGKKVKLNSYGVKGFVLCSDEEKTIEIEGKKFTISELKDLIAKAE